MFIELGRGGSFDGDWFIALQSSKLLHEPVLPGPGNGHLDRFTS